MSRSALLVSVLILIALVVGAAWYVFGGGGHAAPPGPAPAEGPSRTADHAPSQKRSTAAKKKSLTKSTPAKKPSAPPSLVVSVLGPKGRPLTGATVRALRSESMDLGDYQSGPSVSQIAVGEAILAARGGLPGKRATTGADGTATFTGIESGSWFVQASAKGLASADSEDVAVAASGPTKTKIRLEVGVEISGKVVDGSHRPIGAARVVAIAQRQALSFPLAVAESAIAASDGSFHLEGLRRGTSYVLFAGSQDTGLGLGVGVKAPAANVEIVCSPRLTLTGMVTDKDTGDPLSGVHVVALLGTAKTDESGKYRLEGMVKSPLLRYVWLTKDGYQPLEEQIPFTDILFGGSVVHHDFQMKKMVPATIEVTAKDLSGQPLSGVTVTASEYKKKPYASGVTNEAGRVTLTGVHPGWVQIAASKAGYVFVARWYTQGTGGTQSVPAPRKSEWFRVEGGKTKEVSLEFASVAAVSGVVHDPEGRPLAGVTVKSGEIVCAHTDDHGRFTADDVPEGAAHMLFAKEGYALRDVTVVAGSSAPLDVELSPGCRFSGTVVDGDGNGVADVGITLSPADGETRSFTATTKADGTFLIGGLSPIAYELVADRRGYAPLKEALPAFANGEDRKGVKIVLSSGVRADLVLVGPNGAPVSGAVYVYGPLDAPKDQRFDTALGIGSSGHRTMQVTPGRYRLIAVPRPSNTSSAAVSEERKVSGDGEVRMVLGDGPKRVAVRIECDPTCRVVVVRVASTSGKPSIEASMREVEGVWRSPALPPGSYIVTIYWSSPSTSGWTGLECGPYTPGQDVHAVSVPQKR